MTIGPDRRRRLLGVTAASLLALALVGWRSLATPPSAAVVLPPGTADLQPLLDNLAPVPDTTRRISALGVVTLARDPLGSSITARAAAVPAPQLPMRSAARDTFGRVARWTLNGVLITASQRSAIINDQLIRVGGRMSDGARLISVERGRAVLVDAGGRQRVVTVKENNR